MHINEIKQVIEQAAHNHYVKPAALLESIMADTFTFVAITEARTKEECYKIANDFAQDIL